MNTASFWGTIGVRGLGAVMTVANVVLVARVFGPSRRGVLAIAETILGLLVICAGQGLGGVGAVRAARDDGSVPSLLTLAFWWSVVVGSTAALAVSAGTGLLRHLGLGNISDHELRVAMLGLPPQLFNTAALGLLLGAGRLRAFNVVTLAVANAYLPALAIVWSLSRLDIANLLLVASLVQYAIALGILGYFHRSSGVRPWSSVTWRELETNLRFGGKIAATNIASYVVTRNGLLFLDAFRGAEAVGLYAVAVRVGDLLLLVPNIATTVILARLSGIGDAGERHGDTVRLARWLTTGVTVLAIVVVVAGPVLVPFVFGAAFAYSYVPLALLAPGLVCWTLQLVLVQHLAAIGLPRAVVWLWMGVTVGSILMNSSLIARFGPAGAAVATSIAYIALVIGMLAIYRRAISSAVVRDLVVGAR